MFMDWKTLMLLDCIYYSKQSTDLMEQQSKFQHDYFHRIFKNLEICIKPQRTLIAKGVLNKKNKT